MLTPRFSIDQDDSLLTITIYAPFTNLSETEIFIEDANFRFFSKPYFLRLHLPGDVEENDKSSGKYDADTCSFIIKVSKKVPGQHFEGLELLSELLKPKGTTSAKSKIEELKSSTNEETDSEENLANSDEGHEWYVDQELPQTEQQEEKCFAYGFGFKRNDVFSKLLDEYQEILDVKFPDNTPFLDRREKRIHMENNQFDSDHYLCDLYEDEDIKRILSQKSIFVDDPNNDNLKLSTSEREILLGLSSSLDIQVEKENLESVYFGLIDILFAYLYDHKITEGEHSSESGWNISKLCSTLSCSERFANISEVVIACVRRSLIFPLYRHWNLTLSVFADLKSILLLCKTSILKALLKCIEIFSSYEGRYIFNELYLNQYAVWIQSVNASTLIYYAESLEKCYSQLTKSDLQLDLDQLESAASAVVAEGNTQATYYTRSFQDLIESEDSDDSETEDSESSSCPEESSGSSDEEYSSSEDKKLNFEVQNEGIPTENLSSSSQCEVPYLEATDSLKNLKLA